MNLLNSDTGVIIMSNVRPESMARITNFELANAFIEEQVAAVRAQVGDKKVLPAFVICLVEVSSIV